MAPTLHGDGGGGGAGRAEDDGEHGEGLVQAHAAQLPAEHEDDAAEAQGDPRDAAGVEALLGDDDVGHHGGLERHRGEEDGGEGGLHPVGLAPVDEGVVEDEQDDADEDDDGPLHAPPGPLGAQGDGEGDEDGRRDDEPQGGGEERGRPDEADLDGEPGAAPDEAEDRVDAVVHPGPAGRHGAWEAPDPEKGWSIRERFPSPARETPLGRCPGGRGRHRRSPRRWGPR